MVEGPTAEANYAFWVLAVAVAVPGHRQSGVLITDLQRAKKAKGLTKICRKGGGGDGRDVHHCRLISDLKKDTDHLRTIDRIELLCFLVLFFLSVGFS